MAHHAVDLLYIFLTYQSHLPDDLQRLAQKIARHWLVFVNGGQPWRRYDQKIDGTSTLMYFGPNSQTGEAPESTKPAYKNLMLCEKLQDDISHLAALLRGETVTE